MTNNRIAILDSLRAIAALSVCLFHFICTTTGYFQNQLLLSVFSVGKYGVQAFFVISGFVIPWAMFGADYKLKHFFKFFLKRLVRLEPPYLFSVLLALFILFMRAVILGSTGSVVVSPTQILLHIGYLIPWFKDYDWINPVYWTLCVEFQYYLVIALTFPLLISPKNYIRGLMYALYIGMAWIGSSAFLPHWGPVFLMGIVLFLYKSKRIALTEYALLTVLLSGLVIYLFGSYVSLYCLATVGCILFFSNYEVPVIGVLGKFSYSIYLIHPIIGATCINVLSHRFVLPYQKVLVVLGGLLVTLISSWLMYRFVEKPSKNLSANLTYKDDK